MFLEFVPVSSLQTLKNYCSTGVAFATRNNGVLPILLLVTREALIF